MFNLLKKTDFKACLGVRCIGGGGHKIFVVEIRGVTILLMLTSYKFGTPLLKKMIGPPWPSSKSMSNQKKKKKKNQTPA